MKTIFFPVITAADFCRYGNDMRCQYVADTKYESCLVWWSNIII
jgi:hypothetical protein